jgi:hypothetical protein
VREKRVFEVVRVKQEESRVALDLRVRGQGQGFGSGSGFGFPNGYGLGLELPAYLLSFFSFFVLFYEVLVVDHFWRVRGGLRII